MGVVTLAPFAPIQVAAPWPAWETVMVCAPTRVASVKEHRPVVSVVPVLLEVFWEPQQSAQSKAFLHTLKIFGQMGHP